MMDQAFAADVVRRAEEPLLASGVPLMDRASYALATKVATLRLPGERALALVGRGNNGGDALFAAAYLTRRGVSVSAAIAGDVHAEGLAAARRAGVQICEIDGVAALREIARGAGIWIDGLLGIGACGPIREPYASWIRVLNEERAGRIVVAVDVPSGVAADDADLHGPVLCADLTLAMGCLKPAHLLPPARYACGAVEVVELGLGPHLGEPAARQLTDADVAGLWRVPGREDHKYTRGVVGLLTGSRDYPGAGVLSAAGALGGGPGMVRYLGSSPDVMAAHPEVVPGEGRVQAWVIGSGLTDLEGAGEVFEQALAEGLPVVLDAGAIALAYDRELPTRVVLTPHAGELAELMSAISGEEWDRTRVESAPVRAAREAAARTRATVVAKFATTIIAGPGALYAQSGAPGWAGTAGSGDVLAGLTGTILAAHADALARDPGLTTLYAAAAVHVHARAAARAAGTTGGQVGHPITATDIARKLASTIGSMND
ncbi:bifunctional ADP-dependent NAD(P)H-hydrate dehydratase/NAD(P)H-hydrate epimerase [Trueperella bernardiae]|uniref:NAD(P)H-hydrate epimerase n=1 Tax=Trueperella bernardiae TaxID=59561 RepID=UPI0025549F1B|nr:bifunctional ADP-dependent NAD(P)H-hydrate dehydratase/NAD(P)H-hydrate epimerase [Trueperella bernardiae]WIM08363.1 bifunctional ADP-dependent NAD(P)H-hydrate dehydratase/NAD(P)H-hydrate epimerase [Trueperella bernardiae]